MKDLFTQEVMDIIATLEQENRQLRARNERLEKEVAELEKKTNASASLWQILRDSGDND